MRVALGVGAAQMAGCGDNAGGDGTFGGTGGVTDGATMGSSGATPTAPGPTEASASVSDTGTASQASMSEATTAPTSGGPTGDPTGDPTGNPTGNPTTDSATTLPDTDGTSASSDSTGGASDTQMSASSTGGVVSDSSSTGGDPMCAPDKLCNDDCCAADQVCVEAQCQKDCGGPPPCGPQEDCCVGQEICYLGECVVPGKACDTQVCATKIANDCGASKVCDPELKLCLPSKADLNCTYKPPAQVFKPVPTFTWGYRKKVACSIDTDCQTAETCIGKVCTPSWPHLNIAADDRPTFNQSSSTAVVVDLDQDCVPEIVFNTYPSGNADTNGVLRIIRGDNGAKVWTNTDTNYDTNGTANPAVGDLDYDGFPEILVPGETKNILAFNYQGTPLWKSDAFNAANVSSAVAIANLDNDGDAEVIYADAVFDSKGKKLFEGTQGEGKNGQGPISCVADLDGDGFQELIAGKTAYAFSGKVAQNNFTSKLLWNSAVGDGFCGVADFNGDKKPEVIIVGGGKIYALNALSGAKLAEAAIPNGGSGGPPNIADFDGDGKPEVAAAGSTQYIVFKYDGGATFTKLWSAPTDDTSSQVTGSSVFDFDGDGRNEVVYNDEVYLRIYPGVEPDCLKNPVGPACDGNMTDAEVLFRDKNGSRTRTEYPVIADVDGDFKAEIVSSLPRTPRTRRSAAIPRIRAFWRGARDHLEPLEATGGLPFGKILANARAARGPGPPVSQRRLPVGQAPGEGLLPPARARRGRGRRGGDSVRADARARGHRPRRRDPPRAVGPRASSAPRQRRHLSPAAARQAVRPRGELQVRVLTSEGPAAPARRRRLLSDPRRRRAALRARRGAPATP